MTRYVIVGNGVAGVTAAQAIVKAQPGADVHLYSAEPYPYYRRPQLPAFIAGEVGEAEITHRPLDWYEQQSIHVHLARAVVELDPAARRLRLDDGSSAPYDRLLLTTGGWAWMPPVEGADRRGVFTLRTLDDARAIRDHARTVRQATVVGGGLLGLETARALRALGLTVTVLEFSTHLMPRQVDAQGATVLQSILEQQGIRVLTRTSAAAIVGNGAVSGLRTQDGRELPAGLVLCAAGWRSETTLARQAGLAVNKGIVVDEHLQTSAADVYAAGDAAEAHGLLYGIVPAAIEQARAAAANMVAPGSAVYSGTLPFTTLKVAGAELTSLGSCTIEDESLVQLRHADLPRQQYRKLVLQGGRIIGAILLNERERTNPIKQLIERGSDVSAYADRLLDEDFDLRTLL